MPPRARPRGAGRGFTMIEVVVVILIMGVMATLAMTRSPDRAGLQAKGFRDQLVAMLRHARKVAVAQRRDVCVVFEPSPSPQQAVGTYADASGCNRALPVNDPGNAAPPAVLPVPLPPAPPGTAPFVLLVPPGVAVAGPAAIRFNADGQPVPNANQTLNVGAQSFTVSRETGTVF